MICRQLNFGSDFIMYFRNQPVRAVRSVSAEPAAVVARLVADLDNYQAVQEEGPDSKAVSSSPLTTTLRFRPRQEKKQC
jgi:hypothetical protein